MDCIRCHKTFANSLLISKHIFTVHYKVVPIFCDLCGGAFLSNEKLLDHKYRIHVMLQTKLCGRPHEDTVDKPFPTEEVLLKLFKCDLCAAVFLSYEEQLKHKSKIHLIPLNIKPRGRPRKSTVIQYFPEQTELLQCDLCDNAFLSEDTLLEHKKKIHGTPLEVKPGENGTVPEYFPGNLKLLKCDLCNIQFIHSEMLTKHRSKFHSVTLPEDQRILLSQTSPSDPRICERLIKIKSQSLNPAIKRLIDIYSCDLCDAFFFCEETLTCHRHEIHLENTQVTKAADSREEPREYNHDACENLQNGVIMGANAGNNLYPLSSTVFQNNIDVYRVSLQEETFTVNCNRNVTSSSITTKSIAVEVSNDTTEKVILKLQSQSSSHFTRDGNTHGVVAEYKPRIPWRRGFRLRPRKKRNPMLPISSAVECFGDMKKPVIVLTRIEDLPLSELSQIISATFLRNGKKRMQFGQLQKRDNKQNTWTTVSKQYTCEMRTTSTKENMERKYSLMTKETVEQETTNVIQLEETENEEQSTVGSTARKNLASRAESQSPSQKNEIEEIDLKGEKSGHLRNIRMVSSQNESDANRSTVSETFSNDILSNLLRQRDNAIDKKKRVINILGMCLTCVDIFNVIKQMKSKISANGAKSTFCCPFCDIRFTTFVLLQQHMANIHVQCTGKLFNIAEKCIVDINPQEAIRSSSDSILTFQCCCSTKVFDHLQDFKEHIETNHFVLEPPTNGADANVELRNRVVEMEASEETKKDNMHTTGVKRIDFIDFLKCDRQFMCVEILVPRQQEQSDNLVILSQRILLQNVVLQNAVNSDIVPLSVNQYQQTQSTSIQEIEGSFNKGDLSGSYKKRTLEIFPEEEEQQVQEQPPKKIHRNNKNVSRRKKKKKICKQCKQTFDSDNDLVLHRYYIHKDISGIHICDNCNEVLTSVAAVNTHTCANVTSWHCKRCKLMFYNSMSFHYHNSNYHYEKNGTHKCHLCKQKFLTTRMLERHKSESHPTNNHVNNSLHSSPSEKNGDVHTTSPKINVVSVNRRTNTLSPRTTVQTQNVSAAQLSKNNSMFIPINNRVRLMCNACNTVTNSKFEMKLHLTREHDMRIDTCLLCGDLYIVDRIAVHLINMHIKSSNDHTREERDLVEVLGSFGLSVVFEYQRFDDLPKNKFFQCTKCMEEFSNVWYYKLHYLEVHDTTCILCDIQYEHSFQALNHKIKCHTSTDAYLWAIQNMVTTILKMKKYGNTLEDVLSTLSKTEENNNGSTLPNRRKSKNNVVCVSPLNMYEKTDELPETRGTCLKSPDSQCEVRKDPLLLLNNSANNAEDQYNHRTYELEYNDVENQNDENGMRVLVLTEEDLQKHKDNMKEFVSVLCSTYKILSEDHVIKLLTEYVENTDK